MPTKRTAKALKGQALSPAKGAKPRKNPDAVAAAQTLAAENRKQATGRAATLAVVTMLG
jgi:hypothetical protein